MLRYKHKLNYWDVVRFGRTHGLGPCGRRFKSCHPNQTLTYSSVVEHPAVNRNVAGSNPAKSAIYWPIAQWWCNRLLIERLLVRIQLGQPILR